MCLCRTNERSNWMYHSCRTVIKTNQLLPYTNLLCIRYWGYAVALFRSQFRCLHSSLTNNQKPYFQIKCPLNTVIIGRMRVVFSPLSLHLATANSWPFAHLACVHYALFSVGHVSFVKLLILLLVVIVVALNWIWIWKKKKSLKTKVPMNCVFFSSHLFLRFLIY